MSLLFFSCVLCCVSFSYQQNVKIIEQLIPSVLEEGRRVTLKCVISNHQDLEFVSWIKDEEVITNGSHVLRDTSIYLLEEIINQDNGNLIYMLNVLSVSRADFGRWTCRYKPQDGDEESVNVVLNVIYEPDGKYPICEVYSALGTLNCRTQEGNPRIGINWYRQANTRTNIRTSKEITNNGIIDSSLYVSSLDPPAEDNETVTCASKYNSCSVSMSDIYNDSKLELSMEVKNHTVKFNCLGSDDLTDAEVSFDWSKPQVVSIQSSTITSTQKYVVFEKTPVLIGMSVYCRLQWGTYSDKVAEEKYNDTGGTVSGDKTHYELDNQTPLIRSSNIGVISIILGVSLLILVILIISVFIIFRKRTNTPV